MEILAEEFDGLEDEIVNYSEELDFNIDINAEYGTRNYFYYAFREAIDQARIELGPNTSIDFSRTFVSEDGEIEEI